MERNKWTEDEEKFVSDNFESLSVREMSERLSKPFGTVYNKVKSLGLNRSWRWTEEDEAYIRANYLTSSTQKMCMKLGRPFGAVSMKMKRMGLNRPQKGNKGAFKASKSLAIGEVIKVKKAKGMVLMIKVEAGWKPLARHNYEERFGPIPKGYQVHFRDGDNSNCDPDNLVALTPGQAMAFKHQRRVASAQGEASGAA